MRPAAAPPHGRVRRWQQQQQRRPAEAARASVFARAGRQRAGKHACCRRRAAAGIHGLRRSMLRSDACAALPCVGSVSSPIHHLTGGGTRGRRIRAIPAVAVKRCAGSGRHGQRCMHAAVCRGLPARAPGARVRRTASRRQALCPSAAVRAPLHACAPQLPRQPHLETFPAPDPSSIEVWESADGSSTVRGQLLLNPSISDRWPQPALYCSPAGVERCVAAACVACCCTLLSGGGVRGDARRWTSCCTRGLCCGAPPQVWAGTGQLCACLGHARARGQMHRSRRRRLADKQQPPGGSPWRLCCVAGPPHTGGDLLPECASASGSGSPGVVSGAGR